MEATAHVNGVLIAISRNYKKLEGNVYFPPGSIVTEHYRLTDTHTVCPWKGVASYMIINVGDGNPLTDAAWYYPQPKDGATHIKDHVAFRELATRRI
ncbi:hypothetical protein ABW20_dc0101230 [Dactylellina cionopaga]|nr:hypothetical protein ABW20_dc0101230 [Dactylellina cionopaga]